MRVLFVGDGSNYHASLAKGLRELGHETVVASAGCGWMHCNADILLKRDLEKGLPEALGYLCKVLFALPKMRGFDVVHINNPIFLMFRPHRIKWFFDFLKRNNRSIFLSAMGDDPDYVKACCEGNLFKYSEYAIDKTILPHQEKTKCAWLQDVLLEHQNHVIGNVDGIMACLYEYYKVYEARGIKDLAYGGIPIDTRRLQPRYIEEIPEKVKFFLGYHHDRMALKGTDKMMEALRLYKHNNPDKCEVEFVTKVPYAEYETKMLGSHVALDQLYSYTPATNALLAMAQGIVSMTGGEPEFYDFIGEKELRPIINVSPIVENDIYQKIDWIVQNKHLLPKLSHESREFVVKHNDSHLVAKRHIDFWKKTLPEL